ncbi:MAG: hypothetical protein A2W33_07255 [Chloroflexi bacterium RBG_16_52_11]|nr:MAG: hypothetical protein A2W33_07255 [Chloroflexi bacterium RBG_16_52_11]
MSIFKLARLIRKRVAFLLFDFGLLPKKFRARVKAALVFENKELAWNPAGYWLIAPMPSAAELDYYYSNIYWGLAGGKCGPVVNRDIDHWMLLLSKIDELRGGKLRCLNFGAGHGGISYLLYAMGHEVVNVEPSGLSVTFGTAWSTVSRLESIEGEFDLIYGSHSLEHVQDLDYFMSVVSQHLKSNGYVFFEVPNCRQSNCKNLMNGGQNGNLAVPHTYYFTIDYFGSLDSASIINATFDEKTFPNNITKEEDGEVIRYLGRGKPRVQ